MSEISTSEGLAPGKAPAAPVGTKPSLPHVQAPLSTVSSAKKPFGLLTPSPLTKAAPSCSAKAVSTSSATHWPMSTMASSSSVCVAAGMA